MQYDPGRMLEIVRDGAEIHQEADDRSYVDFVRGCGEAGLRRLAEFLRDAEFVSEARRIEARYPWVEEQIARFLEAIANLAADEG